MLLVDVGTGFRLDVGLDFEQLRLLAQGGIKGKGPIFYRVNVEEFLFLLGIERHVGT